MGFLDKAKEQASALAAKAQEGVNQGQAKLSESQANKKAAGLLEQLGAWQWAQQHGRDAGQAQEQTARILAELAAHEAEHGPIGAPLPPAEEVAPPPPAARRCGAGAARPRPAPPAAGAAPPPPQRPIGDTATPRNRSAGRSRGRLHPRLTWPVASRLPRSPSSPDGSASGSAATRTRRTSPADEPGCRPAGDYAARP